MFQWLIDNKEWVLGSVAAGAVIIGAYIQRPKKEKNEPNNPSIVNTLTVNNTIGSSGSYEAKSNSLQTQMVDVKNQKRILFVDDDISFKVVKILKRSGWVNTKIIRDIRSLDDIDVKEADLFFIDIQGVGKSLEFPDEGLGLARALKQKYPNKKLVIYSAEAEGDRFHSAFRLADDQLKKTADPYEFQRVVEQMLIMQ